MGVDDFHTLVCKLKELAKEMGKTPSCRDFSQHASKRQIAKHKYSEIVRAAGLEPNKRAQTTDPVSVVIKPPRVLIYDLEVAPAIAYTYEFRDAFIAPDMIIRMPYILAYAAKWMGEDKLFYRDTRDTPQDDRLILEELEALINEADYVVGHNMKRYDLPTTKARMIIKDLAPLKETNVIDTFKIALKHFKFPFYKLGELAKYLKCENQKYSHAQFPGNSLFTEADKGNIEAFKEMEIYCPKDVTTTEDVLKKLARWEPTLNFQSHYQKRICICGGSDFFKDGIKYTRQGNFQVWRCRNKSCSKTFVGKENLIDKDLRKGFFK